MRGIQEKIKSLGLGDIFEPIEVGGGVSRDANGTKVIMAPHLEIRVKTNV